MCVRVRAGLKNSCNAVQTFTGLFLADAAVAWKQSREISVSDDRNTKTDATLRVVERENG